MPARKLSAEEVALPQFKAEAARLADVFSLSSHHRAREALRFGLSVTEPGFHIFVVGEGPQRSHDRDHGLPRHRGRDPAPHRPTGSI
ncbi:MAG: hypothetical protein WDO24_11605 [Pseudomonadota bacterium]